ncbi:MAG: hypothetical protein A3F84_19190 [Candidatus Handelsmanbacteria bacterium RIFCSPLOWO2_12_FULL_64_10]|uniref:WbqC family protein n=1 Tax=Handelsmanbacteria sp. (strain RIFCSPLOWO2_12_FULL_64_10) TaxID=1817868 RepID=A0A1F6D704_HANXR|nr:MAG: hypothetical protein A3F84_19190 [Candidatus Handelsmanbacteria bacterium RIFCSPLOWO2_12_FULL_64_10]
MTVAIHQPQYLPWLGYFDKMDRADVFVLLDNVQYKKNEFINRNRIKSAAGWQWLTVPVRYRFPERIDQVAIHTGVNWRRQHAQALLTNYGRAPHFAACRPFFDDLLSRPWEGLCDLNAHAVRGLAELLGIRREMPLASVWALGEDPTGRLVDICRRVGADTYLSGAGGQGYLDLSQFEAAGIRVVFQAFEHPVYPQRFGPFEPFMSVVDLLFNCGEESLEVIRRGRKRP